LVSSHGGKQGTAVAISCDTVAADCIVVAVAIVVMLRSAVKLRTIAEYIVTKSLPAASAAID
jgi:hypothetical protein